jgi:hypothetical protein
LGLPYCLSTADSQSIEDVAEANGANGVRFFQLYSPPDEELLESILQRAVVSRDSPFLYVMLSRMRLSLRTMASPHGAFMRLGAVTSSHLGVSPPCADSIWTLGKSPPHHLKPPTYPLGIAQTPGSLAGDTAMSLLLTTLSTRESVRSLGGLILSSKSECKSEA